MATSHDVEIEAHLEGLLVLQNIGKSLACLDTEGVAAEMNLFKVSDLFELFEVRLNVGLGVELEALTDNGEDFGLVRHDVMLDIG